MKILIVSHYFPPEDNMAMIATLRPLSWAKYWSIAGHEVCILTTAKNENYNLQSLLSTNISGTVKIEGVKYILSRPEMKSTIQMSSNEQKTFKAYQFLRKILIKTRQLIGAGSLFYGSDFWIIPAIKKGLKIHEKWKYDVIVSTFGPPSSHIVASVLKQKLQVFWVADYRDLWNDEFFSSAKFPFFFIEKKLEYFTVKHTDILTTVSIPLAEKLKKRFLKSVFVIANGFEEPETNKLIPQILPKTKKIRLAYTGNIYFKKQNLRLLFQAIELLIQTENSIQNKLEILFYGWDTANLNELIKQYCLESIVSVKGFVAREIAISVQREVDALIFLDWNDKDEDGVMTGKIFEYMFSGTPILGIGASLGTTAGRLIQESGTGILLDNSVEALANTIKDLLDGKKIEYSPKKEVLSQYTREFLANKMLQEIIDAYSNRCPDI